jgi:hypothetical protein
MQRPAPETAARRAHLHTWMPVGTPADGGWGHQTLQGLQHNECWVVRPAAIPLMSLQILYLEVTAHAVCTPGFQAATILFTTHLQSTPHDAPSCHTPCPPGQPQSGTPQAPGHGCGPAALAPGAGQQDETRGELLVSVKRLGCIPFT